MKPFEARILRSAFVASLLTLAPMAPATAASTPTIVLVHGAFSDPGIWDGVADRLRADGYRVVAVDNPLRGPARDAAAVQRVLDGISGPVVLAGHSYGGAVITQIHDPKVESRVYVAALAPVAGETGLIAVDPIRFPGSWLPLALRPSLAEDGLGVDTVVDPGSFGAVFAQDADAATVATLIAHQQPLAATANFEPSGPPAWTSAPNWYLVSAADRVVPPALQRFLANRMGAHTSEIDASHTGLVTRPAEVAAVVAAAARG
ncbi:alpha/beta fold hydrolase [Nocardia sp. IFM 10818]